MPTGGDGWQRHHHVSRCSEHDEAPWREREPEALGGHLHERMPNANAATRAPPPPLPPARARAPSLAARMRAVSFAAAPALAARLRRQSRVAKALPTASRAPNPASPSLQEQLAARMQARAARAEAPGPPGGRAAGESGTRAAPAATPSLQEQAAADARARGARALGGAGAGAGALTSDRPPGALAPGELQASLQARAERLRRQEAVAGAAGTGESPALSKAPALLPAAPLQARAPAAAPGGSGGRPGLSRPPAPPAPLSLQDQLRARLAARAGRADGAVAAGYEVDSATQQRGAAGAGPQGQGGGRAAAPSLEGELRARLLARAQHAGDGGPAQAAAAPPDGSPPDTRGQGAVRAGAPSLQDELWARFLARAAQADAEEAAPQSGGARDDAGMAGRRAPAAGPRRPEKAPAQAAFIPLPSAPGMAPGPRVQHAALGLPAKRA